MDHEPEIRLQVEARVVRVLNPRRSNFVAENAESICAVGMFWIVFGTQFFGATNRTVATTITSLCLSVILARFFVWQVLQVPFFFQDRDHSTRRPALHLTYSVYSDGVRISEAEQGRQPIGLPPGLARALWVMSTLIVLLFSFANQPSLFKLEALGPFASQGAMLLFGLALVMGVIGLRFLSVLLIPDRSGAFGTLKTKLRERVGKHERIR